MSSEKKWYNPDEEEFMMNVFGRILSEQEFRKQRSDHFAPDVAEGQGPEYDKDGILRI